MEKNKTMKTIILILLSLSAQFIYSQEKRKNLPMDSIGCLLGKTQLEIYRLYGKPDVVTQGLPPIFEYSTSNITEEKIINDEFHEFIYNKPCNNMGIYFRNKKSIKIDFKLED